MYNSPLAAEPTASVSTPSSLGGSVGRAASWATGSRLAAQGIQLIISVALAHIVIPRYFGYVALLAVFTQYASLLADLSVGAAVVKTENRTDSLLSTAFVLNLIMCVSLTIVVVLLAHPFAQLYHQPKLVSLTYLVALSILCSVDAVPTGILEREFRFRAIAWIEIGSVVSAGAVAIALASAGYGLLGLAMLQVVQPVMLSVLSFVATRWLPRAKPLIADFREITAFSLGLFGFNSLNYWTRNADNFLIGRFVGAVPLAYYARAYNLMTVPVTQLTAPFGRVVFPALARLDADRDRQEQAYLRSVLTTAIVLTPIVVMLAATGHHLIDVVYGERWRGAGPLLVVLAIGGVPQIIGSSTGWLYQGQGRTRTMFYWSLFTSVVTVGSFVAGLPYGAIGVASAYAIRSYLIFVPSLWIALRGTGLSLTHLMISVARVWACCAAMAGAVLLSGLLLYPVLPAFGALLLTIIFGGAVYVLCARFVCASTFNDIRTLLGGMVRDRRLATSRVRMSSSAD